CGGDSGFRSHGAGVRTSQRSDQVDTPGAASRFPLVGKSELGWKLMAGWKDILLDVLKLTDEVKRLNATTEKLAERTIDMDKRLVRLETMVEVAQRRRLPDGSPQP